ncbi:hypothetical protein BDY21DRAFT_271884, partial [Lineolata rhizophorae]
ASGPPLVRWLLDTRTIWAGENIADAQAAEHLALIGADERADVVRKHNARDARMSLGSALLKRLFATRALGIPWDAVRLGRRGDARHGKPCVRLADGRDAAADFNVTHQAGIVALVGCAAADVEVGVDVVCVNERNDYRVIDRDGFDGWVDLYEDFFSDEERWDMKYNVDRVTLLDGRTLSGEQLGRADRCCVRDQTVTIKLPTAPASSPSTTTMQIPSDLIVDAKLRRFYAFYSYKEAFIKLTGDALLAAWLRELEFRHVLAPRPGTAPRCSTLGVWGEVLVDDGVEIWLRGERVRDVRLELRAFEEDYMIATAVRRR